MNGTRILIVAGDRPQAEAWRMANGFSPAEVTYVGSTHTILGLGPGYAVVRVGSWARRVDIGPINEAIRCAGIRELGER